MALSNWDTLAFDLNGPCGGSVTDAAGVRVEIYKNFLYLHDRRKLEVDVGPLRFRYVDEVVGQVDVGELVYGRWTISARRGPQNGIYVVAHSSLWESKRGEVAQNVDKAILVGCGVYGYEDMTAKYAPAVKAAGVDPDTVSSSWSSDADRTDLIGFVDSKLVTVVEDVDNTTFVGVLPSSVEFLKAMVAEKIRDLTIGSEVMWPGEDLAVLPWDKALRANQGDAFFIGADAAATPPGEANPVTVLQRVLGADGEVADEPVP